MIAPDAVARSPGAVRRAATLLFVGAVAIAAATGAMVWAYSGMVAIYANMTDVVLDRETGFPVSLEDGGPGDPRASASFAPPKGSGGVGVFVDHSCVTPAPVGTKVADLCWLSVGNSGTVKKLEGRP